MSTEQIATAPAATTDPASDVVTVCAWCQQLNILKLQRREGDVVNIFQHGKELRIVRNGLQLRVSHGICEPCKARIE